MSNRPLVIYHANCADGFSAAWCFWKKFRDGADYVAGVYGEPPPDVTGRSVYLVDFSYKAEVVERMLKVARFVTLIDHHKTAIEDLRPIKNRFVSTNGDGLGDNFGWFCNLHMSGATLAWDYLYPNTQRPLLLGHIEDRDLWKFELAGTREINAFVFSHSYSFEKWDQLMAADPVELMKMTAAGAAIERKHHKDVAELAAVCKRRMIIGTYNVPAASLPYTMVSDAAELMAQGERFAACYWDTKDHRIFGLRSAPDGIDVSTVAQLYGGGGHKHAAGFKVPRDHLLACC